MNPQLLLIGVVLFIFISACYSANKLHNKIHIYYRRVDRALIEKDVKLGAQTVSFYGFEYKILPDRVGNMEWKRGIHALLPIWRHYLIFDWDNDIPQDPSSYEQKVISPRVRNLINQEARMGAFAKGVREQSTGKKASGLAQYLPLIAIAGVVILGFALYTMSQKMNLIEQLIKVGK